MDVDLNLKSDLFLKAVFELIDTQPPNISHNFTWESLTLTEGYEKPPKEDLERKYQELIDGFPIQQLRETRNILLKETDWTDKYNIEEWVAYRQALRDLPANTEDPTNPVWPEQPQVKIVQEKNTWTELNDTKADLSETKSVLEADLQTTKSELKADLQTTQTELTEERTLHETTRTQLRNTQTELDVAKIKLLNIEARMQIIESNISKVVV
jgi:hypothetical protein